MIFADDIILKKEVNAVFAAASGNVRSYMNKWSVRLGTANTVEEIRDMKNQIRVLMIVPNLRVSNGVASYAMNYYHALDHEAVRMDFCLLSDVPTPYYEEIKQKGGRVFILPKIKNVWNHIKKCEDILNNGNYDIVHDNSLLLTYPIMKVATKNVPVRILHSHNSQLGETVKKEKRNKYLLPLLLKQANAYAACSDLAAVAMFGNKKCDFIPNIIDPVNYLYNEETRVSIRKKMHAEEKFIIATVGRVALQKNPFFALDVFDIVAERNPMAEYWWVGSGPLDKEFAEYVSKLKHSDKVKILGSRNDVKDLYQAFDVFFLPSFFEGLPVTGVEAQAMGLPSVISDTITKEVAYTDLVEFVSLDTRIETWVEAIEKQMSRISKRRSYTKELENSIFSSVHAGEKIESYYRRLLSERSR